VGGRRCENYSSIRYASLTLPDTEPAQAFDILMVVAAVPTDRAPRFRHNPEPLGEPEVAYGDIELLCGLGYRERMLCSSHALIERLTVRLV
jgi:hypothetical protein